MLILDKPRAFIGNAIALPLYHRGPLSLFPGARVQMCILPPRAGPTGDRQPAELLVASPKFTSWTDLWRVTATFRDRVGIMADLFAVLRERQINVVSAESTSLGRRKLHKCEVVIDARTYSSQRDGDSSVRIEQQSSALRDLEDAILGAMIDSIELHPDGQARLHVYRLWSLFEANRQYLAAKSYAETHGGASPGIAFTDVKRLRESIVGRRGRRATISLELPPSFLAAMGVESVADSKSAGANLRYLPVSDTNERLLRVYFFNGEDVVVAPTVTHRERPGACAAIAARLRDAGFDILTCLSRLHEFGDTGATEFVLQAPSGCSSEHEAREKLLFVLSTRELCDEFALSVDFEFRYGHPTKPIRLTENEESTFRIPAISCPIADEVRTVEAVRQRLANSVSSHGHSRDDFQRLQLADALLQRKSRPEFDTTRLLFVSYALADTERFTRLAQIAESMRFQVVSGTGLGEDLMREEIVQRIRLCRGFCGLWSANGAMRQGSKRASHGTDHLYWPSPWLHWEWGVACALALPSILVVHEQVSEDAWRKIMPERMHSRFSDATFDLKCREALTNLSKRCHIVG